MALLTLLAAAVRLATLPHLSFWGDEVWTLKWSQLPLREILGRFAEGLTMHLYLVGMKAWMALAGSSELALKAPSLVAGILTVPALALAGRRFADDRAALLAAALAVASVPLVEYSRFARVYAILVLLSLGIMALYLRALREPRARDLLALGLANGAALMLSGVASYLLVVQGVSLAFETGRERSGRARRLLGFAASFGLSGLLALAFYFAALRSSLPFLLGWTGAETRDPRLLLAALEELHSGAGIVAFPLLALGVLAALRRGGAAGRLLVTWALAPLLFVLAVGLRHSHWSVARFLLLALPAQLLLVGEGALWLGRALLPARASLVAGALALAVAAAGLSGSGLRRLLTERQASALAAARVDALAAPRDRVSAEPDHMRWLLLGRVSAPVVPLHELIGLRHLEPGARLVLLTQADPIAADFWSRGFALETVGGPAYRETLAILVSPELPDVAALRRALEVFVRGYLAPLELRESQFRGEPTTTGELYYALAQQHGRLALLSHLDGRTQQASEHRRRFEAYRAKAAQRGFATR